MIKLYDRNRTYITDIDNHVRVGYEKDFRATWSASLELLANDPVNIMIQPFFMIDIWDDYGEYIGKYRILPKSASVSGNSSIISYNCHHVLHTLLDSTIRKKRYFENTDLPTAIKDVLKWQVEKHWVTGNVSSLTKVQGMEMGVQTGLLSPLLELIGHSSVGEYFTYNTLTYPWVLNVAKVTPLNCRIKEGYNMSSFEIETDPTGIVNRVYGYGAIPEESTEDNPLPPITVAGINNGLEYIEDAESIAKYGVKEYVFTDERYESDISLLEAMKYILKSLSAEVVRVRCTAHDIIKASDNPLSIDEIRMGRTVFFDTEDFGAFEMTITKESKSDIFGDPTTMEIELSLDYSSMPVTGISRDIQIIKKEIIATQNAVRIAADGKTVVETGPNEPVNPKVGTLWYKQVTDLETGLTAYKMHVWNGETWRVIDDDIDRALEDLAASKVLIDSVKTQADQLAIDLENGLSMALTEDGILDAINAKANRIIFVAGGDGTHHVLQLTSDGVFIDKGLIQEAHIANGSITDAKIGDLTFGWAVGQTIDAQLIRVVNLDANSVTSGKFSGERLEIGSITREHIADGALDEYTTIQQWNDFLVSYDTFKSEITQTVTDKVGNLEQTLNSKIQQQVDSIQLSVEEKGKYRNVISNADGFAETSHEKVAVSGDSKRGEFVFRDSDGSVQLLCNDGAGIYFFRIPIEQTDKVDFYTLWLGEFYRSDNVTNVQAMLVDERGSWWSDRTPDLTANTISYLAKWGDTASTSPLRYLQFEVTVSSTSPTKGVRLYAKNIVLVTDQVPQITWEKSYLSGSTTLFKMTKDAIESKVSKTEYSGLTTRVEQAEQKLTPTSITQTVENNTTTLATKAEVQTTAENWTAKFSSIGGRNLYEYSENLLNRFVTYEGSQYASGYPKYVDVPEYDVNNAVQLRTTNVGDSVLKLYTTVALAQDLENGEPYTMSFYIKNNRTNEYMEVGSNRWPGIERVEAGETKRVVFSGVGSDTGHAQIQLRARGVGYYIDCALWHVKLERGWVATEYSTKLYTGITEIDRDGVTVGREGETIETNLSFDGLRVYDTISKRSVLEATRDGVAAEIITANDIFVPTTLKKITRNVDLYIGASSTGDGSGANSSNRADSVTTAFERVLDGAKYLEDGVTVNIYVSGSTNETISLKGLIGQGYVNVIGQSGNRINGGINITSNTIHIELQNLNFKFMGTAGDYIVGVHKSLRVIVRSCMFVGESTLESYGISTTGGSNVSIYNSSFYDFRMCVAADTLSNVSFIGNKGSNVKACGSVSQGARISISGTKPQHSFNNAIQNYGGFVYEFNDVTTDTPTKPTWTPPTWKNSTKTFYARKIGTRNNGSTYVWREGTWIQGTWKGNGVHVIGFAEFGSQIRDWLNANGGYQGTPTVVVKAKRNESSGNSPGVSMKIYTPNALTLPAVTRGKWTSATAGSALANAVATSSALKLQSTTSANADYAGFTNISITVTAQKKI